MPPPPEWPDLEAALAEAAADCADALERLRHEASDARASRPSSAEWGELAPAAPPLGVVELACAHLAQLCALRLFGAARVAGELEGVAAECRDG